MEILGDVSLGLDLQTLAWPIQDLNMGIFLETATYEDQARFRMAQVFKNAFIVKGDEFYWKVASQNKINDKYFSMTNSDSVSFIGASTRNYKPAILRQDVIGCNGKLVIEFQLNNRIK